MFVFNFFKKPITNCQHYKRNCDKKAPCCGIFVPCRLCHDSEPKGCRSEVMDRYQVSEVRCRKCLAVQPVSNKCINCSIKFANYFCLICKFYDDDQAKQIYHCDKCKMCRKGKKEDFFHCNTCGICIPNAALATHKCLNNVADDGCPVCLKNLKISTNYIIQLPNCPHFMHSDCLQNLVKFNRRNCPICSSPIIKMSQNEIQTYDRLAQDSILKIPESHKDQKVQLYCLDCKKQSQDVSFNFYLKCIHCGSYNTKQ